VTLDEALARLNAALPLSRRDAKRVYLKQVKLHPPESDPEGFRAVREAFETLDRELCYAEAAAAWRERLGVAPENLAHREPTPALGVPLAEAEAGAGTRREAEATSASTSAPPTRWSPPSRPAAPSSCRTAWGKH
jgi:hypothetical protein